MIDAAELLVLWWRHGGPGGDPVTQGVALTAEQTHFLLALMDVDDPPGVEPLRRGQDGGAIRSLLYAAAAASLSAAGVIRTTPDGGMEITGEVAHAVRAIGIPDVRVRVTRIAADGVTQRVWGIHGASAATAVQLSDSDYLIRLVTIPGIAADVMEWLRLPTVPGDPGPAMSAGDASAPLQVVAELDTAVRDDIAVTIDALTIAVDESGGHWVMEPSDDDWGEDGLGRAPTRIDSGEIAGRVEALTAAAVRLHPDHTQPGRG